MSSFIHLHTHTQYSLLGGALRLKDLFSAAAADQMDAVAITDRGNLFGAVDFYKKGQKSGVKPILGCTFRFTPHCEESGPLHQLVLLARDNEGYESLRRLLSRSWLEFHEHGVPRADFALLEAHRGGLVALSGGVQGIIEAAVAEGKRAAAVELIERFRSLYGQEFHLAVQPLGTPRQQKINQEFRSLGRELGVPLCATNESFYLRQEEARAREVHSEEELPTRPRTKNARVRGVGG